MKACQVCLKLIDNNKPIFYLNDIYVDPNKSNSEAVNAVTIREKLADCVPELLLDSMPNGILCESCINFLMMAYEFRQKCLETQHKIYGYLQQMPANTKIDVNEIALYYKRLEIVAKGGNPFDGENTMLIVSTAVPNDVGSSTNKSNTSAIPNLIFQTDAGVNANNLCDPVVQKNLSNIVNVPKENYDRLKSFQCQTCNMLFSEELDLKDHVVITHQNPLLRCNTCNFTTRMPFIMRKHNKQHKKKEKWAFSCNLCSYRAKIKQSLTQHTKDKHKKKSEVQPHGYNLRETSGSQNLVPDAQYYNPKLNV